MLWKLCTKTWKQHIYPPTVWGEMCTRCVDISGFHSLESRRTFLWITAGHTDNIRRNALDKILSFLHDNDSNNLPKYKKVGWVSKYLDELRSNVKTHWICERELDMDRCMVEYFGWYGTFLRQSIKMKSKWFENKIWCANLPVRYFFEVVLVVEQTMSPVLL